uniref:ATP synthase subunit 8 n=1 Tax=Montfortula punctata TaxID=1906930 RepID=A0A1J0CYH6_9VEST|nr:ATP synthase subunit 8 [Montfortula punctata]
MVQLAPLNWCSSYFICWSIIVLMSALIWWTFPGKYMFKNHEFNNQKTQLFSELQNKRKFKMEKKKMWSWS